MANGTSGTGGNSAPVSYTQMSDTEGAALLNSNPKWQSDPDVAQAIDLYQSNTNPYGNGFSYAQNLNHKLANDMPLTPIEQKIDTNLQKGMTAIGKDVQLVRFCHDSILKQLGVNDYSKLTGSELKEKLVGATFKTTSYLSTSYNGTKSPFAPGQPKGGGRELYMKINAKKNTKFAPGDKSQAELVLNKGSKVKVTNVYYDGTKASPNSIYPKKIPRVVLEVERSG